MRGEWCVCVCLAGAGGVGSGVPLAGKTGGLGRRGVVPGMASKKVPVLVVVVVRLEFVAAMLVVVAATVLVLRQVIGTLYLRRGN